MQVTKTIAMTERLTNSENGNPRYRIVWTDGTANNTMPDAAIAHGITNSEYQGVPLLVTLERGQVINAKPEEEK